MSDFLEILFIIAFWVVFIFLVIRLTKKRVFTKAKRPLNFFDYWLTAFILIFFTAIIFAFGFFIVMLFNSFL